MGISSSFINAVDSNDIRGIRIMMENSLIVDPTFKDFDKMEELSKNVPNLYDDHDGQNLKQDKSTWNDDYINKLKVDANDNFSHERINHLKEVVRYLHPIQGNNNSKSKPNTHQPSYQEQKREDERKGIILNRTNKIVLSTVCGGVIGGAIASATASSVFIGVAIGSVLSAATVTIITSRGDKDEH